MMHLIIVIGVSGLTSLAQAQDGPHPPMMWKGGLRTQHQEVWDRLRKDDGKVSASEVIEWMYKNHRSHHDGDSQKHASYCLIQLEDDPLQHLRKMMKEEKAERRAYAVLLAGMLGDPRIADDVKRLTGDGEKLGRFDGEWFWGTVAEIAKEASRSLEDGGIATHLRANGVPIAAWVPPSNSKAEQAGTGQPADRARSESENDDKPQPEAEGRSR